MLPFTSRGVLFKAGSTREALPFASFHRFSSVLDSSRRLFSLGDGPLEKSMVLATCTATLCASSRVPAGTSTGQRPPNYSTVAGLGCARHSRTRVLHHAAKDTASDWPSTYWFIPQASEPASDGAAPGARSERAGSVLYDACSSSDSDRIRPIKMRHSGIDPAPGRSSSHSSAPRGDSRWLRLAGRVSRSPVRL